MRKLPYIDLMRATAIILVVMVHVGQKSGSQSILFTYFYSFGQMGVQLFFVASALTLCMSLEKRVSEKQLIVKFYVRRFFRIAPLYYLGILIYVVYFSVYFKTILPPHFDAMDLVLNILFVHGISPSAMNTVVPGGWSIGCEMLFYVLFPFLFKYVSTLRKAIFFLFISVGIDLLFNYILAKTTSTSIVVNSNSTKYYFIANQLPAFSWGFILYYLTKRNILNRNRRKVIGISFLFLPITVGLLLWVWKNDPVGPLSHCFVPAIGGGLFMVVGILYQSIKMAPRIILKIGQCSYSIYILHFVIVWSILPLLLKINWYGKMFGTMRFCIGFVVVLFISYGIAILTENYIEKKGIKLGQKLLSKIDEVL